MLRTRPGNGDGHRGDNTVTTFAARLRELDGTRVYIGVPGGLVQGKLRTGRGQVRITDTDGAVAYVPAGALAWVRPADD